MFNSVSLPWKEIEPLLELVECQEAVIIKYNMISLDFKLDNIIIFCAMIAWLCILFLCVGPCLMFTSSLKNNLTGSKRRIIHHMDDRKHNLFATWHPRHYSVAVTKKNKSIINSRQVQTQTTCWTPSNEYTVYYCGIKVILRVNYIIYYN